MMRCVVPTAACRPPEPGIALHAGPTALQPDDAVAVKIGFVGALGDGQHDDHPAIGGGDVLATQGQRATHMLIGPACEPAIMNLPDRPMTSTSPMSPTAALVRSRPASAHSAAAGDRRDRRRATLHPVRALSQSTSSARGMCSSKLRPLSQRKYSRIEMDSRGREWRSPRWVRFHASGPGRHLTLCDVVRLLDLQSQCRQRQVVLLRDVHRQVADRR